MLLLTSMIHDLEVCYLVSKCLRIFRNCSVINFLFYSIMVKKTLSLYDLLFLNLSKFSLCPRICSMFDKYFILILKERAFYCCWAEGSISVSYVKWLTLLVQIFHIFIDFFVHLFSQLLRQGVKISYCNCGVVTTISPCSFICFSLVNFEALLLGT